jgi:iron complex outermembrane receptor protein
MRGGGRSMRLKWRWTAAVVLAGAIAATTGVCRAGSPAADLDVGHGSTVAVTQGPGHALSAVELDLPAQPLAARKRALEQQFRVNIFFSLGTSPEGITAPGIKGLYTLPESLGKTLEQTAYSFRPDGRGNYRICIAPRCDRDERGLPEIVITTGRAMNVDIPRSEDDSGPYIVFDREQLERSSASNVEGFLRAARPGSVPGSSPAGATAISGMGNAFNLRGLPVLVLFDGRRRPAASLSGDEQQPDLLSISTAATERVEMRTGSASAPYGAEAIGGVVNVITRRMPGATLSVRTEQLAGISARTQEVWGQQTFDLGSELRWVSLTGLFSRRDAVQVGDWARLVRGRELIARNNPAAWIAAPIPIIGERWNARSIDGSPLLPGGTSPILSLVPHFRLGDDVSVLREGEGKYSWTLAPSAHTDGGIRATFRPALETRSADVAGKWSFSPTVWANFEVGHGENEQNGVVSALDGKVGRALYLPAVPGISPFRTDALIAINLPAGDASMVRADTLVRGAAGLTVQVSPDSYWHLDDSWASARAFVFRPTIVGDGQQIAARILSRFNEPASAQGLGIELQSERSPEFRNTLRETTLSYSGKVSSMPFTVALARLHEEIVNAVAVSQASDPAAPVDADLLRSSRRTKEVYSLTGELDLLLHGNKEDASSHPFSAKLAVRGDTFRISTPPQGEGAFSEPIRFNALSGGLSLDFHATESLRVRSHISTGFAPAPLSSLTMPHTAPAFYPQLTDPKRGGEPVGVFMLTSGGNPHLSPEHSLEWGAGLVFRARGESNLRIAVDYSWIRRKGVALTPAELFFARGPTYFEDFVHQIGRALPEPGDPYEVGRIVSVNTQSQNIAEQMVEAIDLAIDWEKPLSIGGTLQLSMLTAFTPTFMRKTGPADSSRNGAGWGGTSPLRYAVGASAMYERGRFLAGITTRYLPEYEVSRDFGMVLSQGARTVEARSFSDVMMSYAVPFESGDLEVRIDARNVFRQRPAVDIAAPDFMSPYSRGELSSYSLSLRKRF